MISAVIIAITLHVLVIWFFLHNKQQNQWETVTSPPSVVMEFSLEAEAEQITEVNIGKVQELSVASKAQEAMPDTSDLPKVDINEKAEVLIAKTEKRQEKPVPEKKKIINKQKLVEEIESDDSRASAAPVTSNAAALKKTSKVAAQFNSDSQAELDAKKQWEALVIGKLNKFKRYPDDARRRGRTVIKFEVDAQGYVINSTLVKVSGTRSLDREAEKVLSRAQPLPIPPAEIIRNGKVIVQMPIDFSIENN